MDNAEYFAMSGEEVAQELGITRQCVSQTLKAGLKKLYYGVKKLNPDMEPTEIIGHLANYMGIDDNDDLRMFYKLFPKEVKNKIYN